MARVHKSIQVEAPRDHVFALAVDMAKQPEWTTFVKEVVIVSGDGKSEGTTDRTVYQVGPRARTSEGVWTQFRPGEAFARKSTSGMPMEQRMTFSEINGGTRVEWLVEYRPPMGALGRFMDLLVMNRVFQNEIEASLDNLKAALET